MSGNGKELQLRDQELLEAVYKYKLTTTISSLQLLVIFQI